MARQSQVTNLIATAALVVLAGCSQPSENTQTEQDPVDAHPVTLLPEADKSTMRQELPAQPPAIESKPAKVVYPVELEHAAVTAERSSPQMDSIAMKSRAAADIAHADPGAASRQAGLYFQPVHRFAPPANRENYAEFVDNPLRLVTEHPVSTFSIDVDTGSYTNVRRLLMQGRYPPANAVRAEEFINYFDYGDFPEPAADGAPFRLATEMGPTPWNSNTRMLRIGLQGIAPDVATNRGKNLVFLIDVSGSMQDRHKLPLLKSALKLLARQLDQNDRISIAVYAGAAGAVLEPVAGNETHRILSAIDQLRPGGSTNGAAGIRLAYEMARTAYIDGGVNRVIIATDGDFNVGTVSFDALKALVAAQRESGIALTSLGFGSGNYNDHLMEQLADVGNGNYFYIDNLNEAQKVLVRDLASTVHTIASDVKIQIEFNPARVAEYRLIGYENRSLKREDFNNDQVDAGEIGAEHRVTALYEVALRGGGGERVDPLRYGSETPRSSNSQEIAYVRLRYKPTHADASQLIEKPITSADVIQSLAATSNSYRFAAAVSAFAQGLRGGDYLEGWTFNETARLAGNAKGQDPFGYRGEFIQLVNLADALRPAGQDGVAGTGGGH